MSRSFRDDNSLISKNTRYLERILFEDGNVKYLIPFDYDKMYVFDPYGSAEEMEKQIGFKFSKLRVAQSEGMVNILFIKDN